MLRQDPFDEVVYGGRALERGKDDAVLEVFDDGLHHIISHQPLRHLEQTLQKLGIAIDLKISEKMVVLRESVRLHLDGLLLKVFFDYFMIMFAA